MPVLNSLIIYYSKTSQPSITMNNKWRIVAVKMFLTHCSQKTVQTAVARLRVEVFIPLWFKCEKVGHIIKKSLQCKYVDTIPVHTVFILCEYM